MFLFAGGPPHLRRPGRQPDARQRICPRPHEVGNDTRGTRASAQGPVKFDRDDTLYVSTLRRTTYDASGSFSFLRVPDGVCYVTTSVKWDGPGDRAEAAR